MSRDLEGDKHQVQKLRAHWEAVVCFKNKAGVGVGGGGSLSCLVFAPSRVDIGTGTVAYTPEPC